MKTLKFNQMERISGGGGVTEEEYCKTLKMIRDNPENILPEISDFMWEYHNCSYWTS